MRTVTTLRTTLVPPGAPHRSVPVPLANQLSLQNTPSYPIKNLRMGVAAATTAALGHFVGRWAGGAGRAAGHLRAARARGAGRTLQIHFRPAATACHASERKLAAASERVSRLERRAAHARYTRSQPAPSLTTDALALHC
ncbi:hypothetical protein K1T71_003966 [Dendrolimus kikuchii]|uniref:Uncharacterized protein n=1 Tax=Dendrolimus kikuchii TaxID=765133 RepID=A0ACC1DAX9_9NEOP|nr:hypothetical protein K1T71_003966 [Dendrolimus kikuchii]